MPHTGADGEPWTFGLDASGDLAWTDQHRPAIVRGDQATVQDLKVALDTYAAADEYGTEGDDPRDPEFGLNVFAATRSMQSLKREIRRTLMYDDYRHNRVTAIQNLEIHQPPGRREGVVVDVTVSLSSVPEDVTLVFDLSAGVLGITGAQNL